MLAKIIKYYGAIGIIKNDSGGLELAIKTFNWILFWTFWASFVWSLLLYFIGQYNAVIFPIFAIFLFPTILIIFSITKNFKLYVNSYLILLSLLPAAVQIFSGGFQNSGAVIAWAVLTPVVALVFKSPKISINWFFYFISIIIISIIAELFLNIEYVIMNKKTITILFSMNLIGIISLCFFPFLIFSRQLYDSKKIIESKNQKIIQSINYARYIQKASLFSSKEFNSLFNNKSFLIFEPKDIVSGDFYWAFESGEHVFLACSDCTGHGVPGAFMTMIGINHLNSIIRENHEEDTALILTKLHERVISSLKHNSNQIHDGMDITICKINMTKRTVEYTSAMSKVFHHTGKKLITCKSSRCSIGDSRRKIEYQSTTLELRAGDMLYLTTDGFIDQFGGPRNKKFGTKRLVSTLNQISSEPIEIQRKRLLKEHNKWQGNQEQIDDITLIGIRF